MFRVCLHIGMLLTSLWMLAGLGSHGQSVMPSAGVIAVNTFEDGLITNGNCSLREAIQAANTDQPVDACPAGFGADTIVLPAGVYTLTVPGTAENANQTGDLDIDSDLSIVGQGMDKTIIDGGYLDRVIDIPSEDAKVEIRDLTIQHGLLQDFYPDPVPWQDDLSASGAGIRGEGLYGSLIVTRVRFATNFIDQGINGMGAAMYTQGYVEVHGSEIISNDAADSGGGIVATRAILIEDTLFKDNYGYGDPALSLADVATVRNVVFSGSQCGPSSGGVIRVKAPTVDWMKVEISNATFTDNNCEANMVAVESGNVTLSNSHFYGDHSMEATIRQEGGKLHIQDTTFDQEGGNSSLWISGGSALFERSSVTRQFGGALRVTGGVTQATNLTISNTGGADNSSGIAVESGSLLMESITITDVQSDIPALLVTGGQVIVHNSLIANNRASDGQLRDCSLVSGTTVSEGYNLISVRDDCGWRVASGDQLGTRSAPIAPRLDVLTPAASNGTFTRPLLPNSPAIDRADPALCPPIDQRGILRPQGSRCDIGAYEAAYGASLQYSAYFPFVWR
jgi:CSLREA domain-containing protein